MDIKKVMKKIESECSKYRGSQSFAFFHDAYNNLHIVCIVSNTDSYNFGVLETRFISFDEEGNKSGFIVIEDEGKQMYLSEVYTFTKYRSRGIAKELNNIMNFHLSKSRNIMLYGIYAPQQMSDDLKKGIRVPEEELDARARKFYNKAGFNVLSYESYQDFVDNGIPELNEEDCFNISTMFILNGRKTIVYKDIDHSNCDFGYHYEGDYLLKNGFNDERVLQYIGKSRKKENKLRELLYSFGWSENKIDDFVRLNDYYGLLEVKNLNKISLPKDILIKLKEISFSKHACRSELYDCILDLYRQMESRCIVVKR